jgi:predicted deacetylase
MKVIVAVHDVSPYFRKEIEIILKELEGIKKSFLVSPLWKGANKFDKDFAKVLIDEELVLHGLTHTSDGRDYLGKLILMSRQSLKEFYGLNEQETRERIQTGIKLFQESFHRTPVGFVPPMWYHNSYTHAVLKELNFSFTESDSAFINLKAGRKINSIPMCFDFGNNVLLNYISIYGWKYVFIHLKQNLIRLSIHPSDVKNGLLPHILKIIQQLNRKNAVFINYNELINT